VVLSGEADAATAALLREALAALLDTGTRLVTVDASGLSFLDSASVRVLVLAARALRGRHGTLVLARPQPVVARLLEITGADRLLEVRSALQHRGPPGSPGSGRRELLVDGDALDVPGPGVVAGVAARALRGGGGGIRRGEHDDAHPLAAVVAAQPLAADEAGLLPGPPDDVLAQVPGGLVGARRIDRHPDHDRVHVLLLGQPVLLTLGAGPAAAYPSFLGFCG
jgi:anti-anti-sigma factor